MPFRTDSFAVPTQIPCASYFNRVHVPHKRTETPKNSRQSAKLDSYPTRAPPEHSGVRGHTAAVKNQVGWRFPGAPPTRASASFRRLSKKEFIAEVRF